MILYKKTRDLTAPREGRFLLSSLHCALLIDLLVSSDATQETAAVVFLSFLALILLFSLLLSHCG